VPRFPECDYILPSLCPEEVSSIESLEGLLRGARGRYTSTVPIFWDTETTGLAKGSWWQSRGNRIFEIAAHTTKEFGGHELSVKVNPWPVQMDYRAEKVTGMSTEAVWGHALPLQV
jgi:hypothetical protein